MNLRAAATKAKKLLLYSRLVHTHVATRTEQGWLQKKSTLYKKATAPDPTVTLSATT